MKKGTVVVLLILSLLLLFFFRPRSVSSLVTKGVENSTVEIVSIKKYDNGLMTDFQVDLYDLDKISNSVRHMSLMPYPWGREMNVEFDKPYIIIDLIVNDQAVTIDVIGNQIGIYDKNYWVYNRDMLDFDIDDYLK